MPRQFYYYFPGDVCDRDWTLHLNKEARDRYYTNIQIQLEVEGKDVCFRSSGKSMLPHIRPQDLCTFLPVGGAAHIDQGDVVFCKVRETGFHYAHFVGKKVTNFKTGETQFHIFNAAGRYNGHCNMGNGYKDIFGKLVLINFKRFKEIDVSWLKDRKCEFE